MKNYLTGLLTLAIGILNAQVTIEKADLNFEQGVHWNNLNFDLSGGTVDVTPGANKTWDFSVLTGGSADTTKILSNDGTSILASSNTKGDVTYQIQDTTFTLKFLMGIAADDPNAASIGLPHWYGKTWSYDVTGLNGFISANISGEVVAYGDLTIPLGTFSCLLIKEDFTGPANETNYYWESREYGRIAVFYSNTDELIVFQDSTTVQTVYPDLGPTITKGDLRWHQDRQENLLKYDLQASALQVGGGQDVVWDFTGLTGGTPDTNRVISVVGDTIKMLSQSLPEHWFEDKDTTFGYLNFEGNVMDAPNNTTNGLPHKYGKSWFTTGELEGATLQINVQGLVEAVGTVTVPYGTFDCVLVKEEVGGAFAGTNYFWETKEHGRVAARYGKEDAFYVLQDTVQTPYVAPQNVSGVSKTSLTVFPNPSSNGVFNLSAAVNYVVYNVIGSEVASGRGQVVDLSALPKGQYVLKEENGAVLTLVNQ